MDTAGDTTATAPPLTLFPRDNTRSSRGPRQTSSPIYKHTSGNFQGRLPAAGNPCPISSISSHLMILISFNPRGWHLMTSSSFRRAFFEVHYGLIIHNHPISPEARTPCSCPVTLSTPVLSAASPCMLYPKYERSLSSPAGGCPVLVYKP